MPAIMAKLVIRMGRRRLHRALDGGGAAVAVAGEARAVGEGDEQDGIGHGDTDGHDRAHGGLDVDRGAGEEEREHDAGDAPPAWWR